MDFFLLSIFLGVNALRTDAETGILPLILSLPIKRHEYLLARILGVFTTIIVCYTFSVFLFGAVVLSKTEISPFGMNSVYAILVKSLSGWQLSLPHSCTLFTWEN